MGGRVRILVCAFGPFPGVPVNPSARLAQRLGRMRRPAFAGIELIVQILPTRWDGLDLLRHHLAHVAPDAVLLLGVAPRRRALCVETRAVNDAADRADAVHRHPPSRRICPHGPRVLRSTADVPVLLAAARAQYPDTQTSRDAGRYLCNASYFIALDWAGGRPVVFVHVPGRRGRETRGSLPAALGAMLIPLAAQARRVRQTASV